MINKHNKVYSLKSTKTNDDVTNDHRHLRGREHHSHDDVNIDFDVKVDNLALEAGLIDGVLTCKFDFFFTLIKIHVQNKICERKLWPLKTNKHFYCYPSQTASPSLSPTQHWSCLQLSKYLFTQNKT